MRVYLPIKLKKIKLISIDFNTIKILKIFNMIGI